MIVQNMLMLDLLRGKLKTGNLLQALLFLRFMIYLVYLSNRLAFTS